jgi:cell pole-organizing protein PopZ
LRDWLDKHLPTLIERLVQEELERIAKRALED